MQSLQIDKKRAYELYPTASKEFRGMLEDTFGKEYFSQKITDRVKSFDDILSISGANHKDFELRPGETADELAGRKIKLISTVYNEGTVLDPANTDQYKYYPWFRIVKDKDKQSGFGLSFDGYGHVALDFGCRRSPLL